MIYEDYRLQSWLKKEISNRPIDVQIKLKSLKNCCRNLVHVKGAMPAVYLLSNGHNARFFGHATCKNTWSCPICTARVMEKRRARIASALDALHDKYFAFAVTFTIPHLAFQSANEVIGTLYATWRTFIDTKNQKHRATQFNKIGWQFLDMVKFYVKVAEYTWGKNGWHPHLHCIFWTERKNKDKILDFQSNLEMIWKQFYINAQKRYWKLHKIENRDIDRFIAVYDGHKKRGYSGVKISTQADGSILEAKSSAYLCGWGSDSESTGNIAKVASHAGHYTPQQILEKAAAGDKKFADLYIEFACEVATSHHRRVAFSKGLKKIIDDWINIKGMESVLSKKKEDCQGWRVLLWFTEEQWYDLCIKNNDFPILSNILFLASVERYHPILFEYVHVEIGEVCLPATNYLSTHVESIFNVA